MTYAEAQDRLISVGSEHRAEVLVAVLEAIPSKIVAKKLLREWFNGCDAIGPHVKELRAQFERVGFVTDTPYKVKLELPATVYRAAYEDDAITQALSWTTQRETAEFFARHFTGLRGWFLGLKREDVRMFIWQGTCTEAYGYFDSRNEKEVIAKSVIDIEPIAELVSVKKEAAGVSNSE